MAITTAWSPDEIELFDALLLLSRSAPPATPRTFYVSSGTWSVEQENPVDGNGESSSLESVPSGESMPSTESGSSQSPTGQTTVSDGPSTVATSSDDSEEGHANDGAMENEAAGVEGEQGGQLPETPNEEAFGMILRAKRRTSFRDLANGNCGKDSR